MSCKCQRCGKDYYVDVNIPDKIWNEINYKNQVSRFNLLCPECIAFGIVVHHACQRGKYKYGAYSLTEIPRQINEKPKNNVQQQQVSINQESLAIYKCSCGWIGTENELRPINNCPPVCPGCGKENDFLEMEESEVLQFLRERILLD